MEGLGCRVDSKPYSVLGMVWESRGLFAGRKKQCLAGCRTERAAKFKGSKAEIRQGVSLLGLGIASSGNLLTFYTGVSPTHVCCSATWACASRLDFHSIVVPV